MGGLYTASGLGKPGLSKAQNKFPHLSPLAAVSQQPWTEEKIGNCALTSIERFTAVMLMNSIKQQQQQTLKKQRQTGSGFGSEDIFRNNNKSPYQI